MTSRLAVELGILAVLFCLLCLLQLGTPRPPQSLRPSPAPVSLLSKEVPATQSLTLSPNSSIPSPRPLPSSTPSLAQKTTPPSPLPPKQLPDNRLFRCGIPWSEQVAPEDHFDVQIGSRINDLQQHFRQMTLLPGVLTKKNEHCWRLNSDVSMVEFDGRVVEIAIESPNIPYQGLRVGDPSEDVEKRLGDCHEDIISFHSTSNYALKYPERSVCFWIKDSKIHRIVFFDRLHDSDNY